MRPLQGVGPLIVGRLRSSWRLLAVLAFGILAAATLLAVSPVYTRDMTDAGLSVALEKQIGSASRNGFVRFGTFGTPQSAAELQALARVLAEDLSWLTASEVRYARLPDLALKREVDVERTELVRPRVSMQSLSGIGAHARLLEGRLPQPTSDPTGIEVLVTAEGARFWGFRPGERFFASHSFDDCNRPPPTDDPVEARERARFRCIPQATATLTLPRTVAGVIEPLDGGDPYWTASSLSFALPVGSDTSPPVIPVVLAEEAFFAALPKLLAGLSSEFRLTGFADITRLNSANIDSTRDVLAALRVRLEERGAIPDLAMAGPLADFQQRASFNQVSLLLLLLQVVGMAVYYVLLVASLLAERRAEEIAMLRSRGATVVQVVAISAAEAAVLGAGAVLLAPFLASAAVAALGKTGTFESVSGGGFLAFTIVPEAFLFALGGAALAAVAVVIPAFFAARRGMVLYLRGAARPGRPFLQRYYIDLGLVGLAALALWELNQRGSVFDPRSVGGWSADPLLLLSPLLLILAVGALVFRFLPAVLALVSRLIGAGAGPGLALSLWQLTRSPARYTQLALLVIMAAAVGTFAATYSETTDRSQEERALFQSGVDLRLSGFGNLQYLAPEALQRELASIPGVEGAGLALRTALSLGPLPAFGARLDVLGLDPQVTPDLLWFRDDFAEGGLEGILRSIQGTSTGGIGLLLPGQPAAISAWINPTQPRESTTLWARTLDANGVFRLHELAVLDFMGYRRVEAPLDAQREGIRFPLSLLGLLLTQPASGADLARGSLLVDDLAVRVDGEEIVIEDFEGAFRWAAIRTATRNRDAVQGVNQGMYRGNGAGQFAFRTGVATGLRGMYVSDPNIPIPALVSDRFLQTTGALPGNELELVLGSVVAPVSIQGSVKLFPTLDDSEAGFLLLDQRHLLFFAGLTNQTNPAGPNEAWLKVDRAAHDAVVRTLNTKYNILPAQTIDRQKILDELNSDPIVRAGGSGVLLIALIAAFTILALGFVFTLYIGGQARTVVVSVMRALGLSGRQMFAMISLEYLLIAAIGLIVGTIAGLRISATMLSFLNVTEEGAHILPPFALATRWDTVGIAYTATAVAFVAGVAALALYFLRLPVSRILRLTR